MMRIVTGFHAIEELLRAAKQGSDAKTPAKQLFRIFYAKQGPRVKKIIQLAEQLAVPVESVSMQELDRMAAQLPDYLREHRGIVLVDGRAESAAVQFSYDTVMAQLAMLPNALVVILDSITDPHNIGAIVRSADQFGVDAVIVPERNSAGDTETIARVSAGASAWVPIVQSSNLVRTAEQLKKHGFWIFGADAHGEPLPEQPFPNKTVLVMGSEGAGISRLLKQRCDGFTAIPAQGKLDSLNVSVAAGILMYAITQKQHGNASV